MEKPRVNGEVDPDDTDDEETMEESPCGRWLKRREEVQQRNVPGIDNAFLAMDSEEGVEVVWNEICFPTKSELDDQETKHRRLFDNLIQLEHPNIVHFHKYWVDRSMDKSRIVFITEYMSSGSLKQFLKKTKSNLKRLPLQSWKRWCTQIVSALSYLHSCSPPIIHGNLSCDTIFIQHNGLVKIGSVAPDVINDFAATSRDRSKNRHFVAPEYYKPGAEVTTAGDIYSFGICALEMAVLEIQAVSQDSTPSAPSSVSPSTQSSASVTGTSGQQVTEEHVRLALEVLKKDDPLQYDFISKCLALNPSERATARELLFHPILFEVHSLKLLAAHQLVHSPDFSPESVTDAAVQKRFGQEKILVEIRYGQREVKQLGLSDVRSNEKLEHFMDDVQFGIYPLTAFAFDRPGVQLHQNTEQESLSANPDGPSGPVCVPGTASAGNGGAGGAAGTPSGGYGTRADGQPGMTRDNSFASDGSPCRDKSSGLELEARRIVNMVCSMKTSLTDGELGGRPVFSLSILLRLEDKMNRQLLCELRDDDTAESLGAELVREGLINKEDESVVRGLIAEMMETLASGCTSSSAAILDKTDIPSSFYESGLMKDLVTNQAAAAVAAVAQVESPQASRNITPTLLAPSLNR